jgi:HNH endonuclease
MRKYRNYTNDDILNGVKQVKSVSALLKLLDLKPSGGNFSNMKRKLQQLNADCSHFTGMAWSKGEQLKDWSNYSKCTNLKPHLIKLRSNTCECCKNTLWLDKSIKLEVHHIDGDRTNNNLNNLQLLCPNCHAYTDGFRNPTKGF